MYGRDVDSNEEIKEDRACKFIQRIQQVHQAVREQLEKSQAQYKARMTNTGLIISSRLETRYGFTSTRRD
jgi:hypothetical protein